MFSRIVKILRQGAVNSPRTGSAKSIASEISRANCSAACRYDWDGRECGRIQILKSALVIHQHRGHAGHAVRPAARIRGLASVMFMGVPVVATTIPETCQPPSTRFDTDRD